MAGIPLEQHHELTLKQLRAKDVYLFWSPKLDREVKCLGLSAYRLGVWLEAHPEVTKYSERPWGICREGRIADFIALHVRNGLESRVVHSVARQRKGTSKDTVDSESETFAKENHAQLEWFDERSNTALRVEVDNLVRMLPYVIQFGGGRNLAVETAVAEYVEGEQRTIQQIEDALSGERIAVDAAIFSSHFRGLLSVDMTLDLNRLSLVNKTQ